MFTEIKLFSRNLYFDSLRYGSRNIIKNLVRDVRFRAVFVIRLGYLFNNFYLLKPINKILRTILVVLYGIDIHFLNPIGPGLKIVHLGGIVIHKYCRIGSNFTILNNVTLGQKSRTDIESVPQIGNNCYIGVFSALLGGIIIGDNVTIGAHSLVLKSIKDGITYYQKR